MSVVNPAILILRIMNGSTGTGFKSKHSNNLMTIGVINNTVVSLSKNTEIMALIRHKMVMRDQIRPRLT